nr:presqualene diphosphate synthase HpnD [uncultured Rhodopila sp.]
MTRTPLGADKADMAAVQGIVRAAGTSFYRGMRVLPADRRLAMYGIYAFCRIVDDIADDEGSLDGKLRALAGWRDTIAALYQGRTSDPVTRVLALAIPRFQLRSEDFIAIIDGMQSDAETVIVAPTMAELDLYCDRVASAVGRLSVRAFGDSSAAADRVAFNLGRALQLTNILRDIHEDSERGRIYLPREYLNDAGVTADPASIVTDRALPAVCNRLAALAHGYFRDAFAAMESCDRSAMKPARLMGATYDSILSAVERRGWERLSERVSLPKWKKLWLACRYGLF